MGKIKKLKLQKVSLWINHTSLHSVETISAFVHNVKQKFIQSARGIIVARHKTNESRGKTRTHLLMKAGNST